MLRECITCEDEYEESSRRGRPGKITECNSCGEDNVERVKGIVETEDGDFAETKIVDAERFERYQNARSEFGNLGND